MGQAKCYAYMYMKNPDKHTAEEKEIERSGMTIQLTYCQLETGEIQRIQREFSFEELE
jgi:hypothetical protein